MIRIPDEHRTMIVSAAVVDAARAMADTWEGGQGMFVVPCYTGNEITHYLSTGPISASIAQQMPWTDYLSGEEPIQHEGDLQSLVDAINDENPAAGASVELVETILAQCDVSNQNWQDALERLGLSLEAA